MKQSTIAIILLWFMLFCYQAGIPQKKPHKLSSEEVRQVMQADIIRLEKRVQDEHAQWALAVEQTRITEIQRDQLVKKLSDIRRVLDRR